MNLNVDQMKENKNKGDFRGKDKCFLLYFLLSTNSTLMYFCKYWVQFCKKIK